VSAENVTIGMFDDSPLSYRLFVDTFGSDYTYFATTAGWVRDSRNSALQTTQGSLYKLYGEVAAGDLKFYKLNYQQQFYTPITRSVTLFLNGDLGYGDGYGGVPLPFFKNYYAGGPGTVRGYKAFSLGPQDIFGNATGGAKRVVGSAEVLFPFPGAEKDKSLRLSTFVDAGQVFRNTVTLSDLRYSAGLGVAWTSPFGPIRVSIAQPFNDKSGDKIQRLQFTYGTAF
jgi:outer membrane protein insertion porin family